MTYPYGLRGSPAVGGGLPGLPQRGAPSAEDTPFTVANDDVQEGIELLDGGAWGDAMTNSQVLPIWHGAVGVSGATAQSAQCSAVSPSGDLVIIPRDNTTNYSQYVRRRVGATTYEALPNAPSFSGATGLFFSPDGRFLLKTGLGSNNKLYKWDGVELVDVTPSTLAANFTTAGACWSPNSDFFYVFGSVAPYIKRFNVTTEGIAEGSAPTDLTSSSTPRRGCVSKDGKFLAVIGGGHPYIYAYRIDGVEPSRLSAPDGLYSTYMHAAFTKSGHLWLSSSDHGAIFVYDFNPASVLYKGFKNLGVSALRSFAVNETGDYLFTASTSISSALYSGVVVFRISQDSDGLPILLETIDYFKYTNSGNVGVFSVSIDKVGSVFAIGANGITSNPVFVARKPLLQLGGRFIGVKAHD